MNQIADRLAIFMKKEEMPANGLAELLGIQASGISHILSGRNKPGLEFITRFLNAFPKINPDWFILGKGDMYRSPAGGADTEPELFAGAAQFAPGAKEIGIDNFDESMMGVVSDQPSSIRPVCGHKKTKSPVKIIILYSDGTFETFANCEMLDRC